MARSQWAQLQCPDRPPPRPSLAESADQQSRGEIRPRPPAKTTTGYHTARRGADPAARNPTQRPRAVGSAIRTSSPLPALSLSLSRGWSSRPEEEEILNPNQNGVIYNFVDEEARDDSCRRSGVVFFFPVPFFFFFWRCCPRTLFLRDGVKQDNGGWRLRGGMVLSSRVPGEGEEVSFGR